MAFAKRFLCLCTSTIGSVETVVDMMGTTLSMAQENDCRRAHLFVFDSETLPKHGGFVGSACLQVVSPSSGQSQTPLFLVYSSAVRAFD
jgi:hypothetical protein